MATTVMPSAASSCASARVMPSIPALLAEYAVRPGRRNVAHHRCEVDDASPAAARIMGMKDRVTKNTLVRLESITVFHSSSVYRHRLADVHAGVVNQDVHRAEALLHALFQRADLILFRYGR